MEIMHTGSATKNQTPHEGSGCMFCSAMRFCGLAIGDAAPPIFELSAIPRSRAFVISESAGRFRSIGWMIEKQRTGAATLLIHILANMATNMFTSSTVRGFVPALLRTRVAIIFAMLYFDSAAAMVKPPRRSMMTGVHIALKTYEAAALDSRRLWGTVSERTTLRVTARKGTRREVTKRGIAWVVSIR
jgi:hypothetical protein